MPKMPEVRTTVSPGARAACTWAISFWRRCAGRMISSQKIAAIATIHSKGARSFTNEPSEGSSGTRLRDRIRAAARSPGRADGQV